MNDAIVQTQAQEIVVDEIFPHSPEAIWKAITQAELMARWLPMPSTGFEPTAGSRFTYQTTLGERTDDDDNAYAEFVKSAYHDSDIEMVRVIRTLLADTKPQ